MTWLDLAEEAGFGISNLPFGIYSTPGTRPRTGVAIGDQILDVTTVCGDSVHATGTLNAFMAQGRAAWIGVRRQLISWLTDDTNADRASGALTPQDGATLHLPFEVADYVDFYSSQHHAENLGAMFRPGSAALMPNWKHLPVGYHGRAGTVRVSGTPVVRPSGQRKAPEDELPSFGPSRRLDIEAEVGFVVGTPSTLGRPVPLSEFADHLFGVCLVNDWSARDLQSWEYVPLGPFLGKSFLTSVSPWVVPLEALQAARVAPPARDVPLLPYLDDADRPWGLDIQLQVQLNGHVLSRPPFASLYWTAAQQLAHMTANGASLRTGDLYASGTVSGGRRNQRGSLIELSWGGTEPIELPDGTSRTFLEDGDEVIISASAPGVNGTRISFGSLSGQVVPAGQTLRTVRPA
jgi:fumarylacetoacetase